MKKTIESYTASEYDTEEEYSNEYDEYASGSTAISNSTNWDDHHHRCTLWKASEEATRVSSGELTSVSSPQ